MIGTKKAGALRTWNCKTRCLTYWYLCGKTAFASTAIDVRHTDGKEYEEKQHRNVFLQIEDTISQVIVYYVGGEISLVDKKNNSNLFHRNDRKQSFPEHTLLHLLREQK